MREIHIHLHHHGDPRLESIETKVAQILTKTEQIMATQAEQNAKMDELQVALDTKQAAIEAGFATLNASVVDLTAQIVAAGTEAERQAGLDKLVAIIADVQSTVEGPSAPPVP